MIAWMDVGSKGYMTGDDPWGSPINKSVLYRPDTIVVKANTTGIDITLYEIAVTNYGQFMISDSKVAFTDNNSLMHGEYPVELSRDLNINGDNSGAFIIDNMKIRVTGSNIAFADSNAVWNSTSVKWHYPDRYPLQPGNPMDVGVWTLDTQGVTEDIPISIARRVNQSIFSAPGYQRLRFNASFENTTANFTYMRISTGGNNSFCNSSLLNDTFMTDAPIQSFHPVTNEMLGFDLNTPEIEAGRVYNFTIVIYVEPVSGSTRSVIYKPSVGVEQGWNTAQQAAGDSSFSGSNTGIHAPLACDKCHPHSEFLCQLVVSHR